MRRSTISFPLRPLEGARQSAPKAALLRVAIVLSGLEGRWRGIRELLAEAARWRFGLGWYAVAVFLMPPLWAVSLGDRSDPWRRRAGGSARRIDPARSHW